MTASAQVPSALFITHRAQPGQRDALIAVWERHMPAAIEANPDHLAYFYTLDEADPDVLRVCQVYRSPDAAQAFLTNEALAAYTAEADDLLAATELQRGSVHWSKGT